MVSNVIPGKGFELSELDRRILELNQQGLSGGKISRVLTYEGIDLTPTTIWRHLTEMRQDPDNNVKVNRKRTNGTPKNELKWYNIVLKLQGMTSEYTQRHGFKPSSRTMFYDLQDLGILKPTDINQYTRVTVQARLGWRDSNGELIYPKLDINCFTDDSRKTVDAYDDSEPKAPTEPGSIENPYEYINEHITMLKEAPERYRGVGEEGEPGEIGGYWYCQPEYVEVWEEKNDLLPAFKKILEDKHVRIRANKGYSSLEFLYECTEKLREVTETKVLEPEHIHISYCGDCDPSGMNIDYYIKKRLRQLGIPGIDFERIAVTPKQIDEYNLPVMAIEKCNTNTKEFKRLYGNKSTHLNAFFTEAHINDFTKILLDAVDKHWVKSIYDEMVDKYEIEAEEPPKLSEAERKQAIQDMYKSITKAFRPGWYR